MRLFRPNEHALPRINSIMGLETYNKKRHFNETPEPKGKTRASKGALRFVVQKHDATTVHYDFRLEMDGVLKSWAVPKGPSLNPSDKRLAMQVEDHPFDYRTFEGVIPEGNYGGGTVIVWDEGTYETTEVDGASRKEQEKSLLQQLKEGKINLVLHGKKLNGAFSLFQMKGRGEKSWILAKKKDEFASGEDISLQEQSVKTGKTLVEVAHEHDTEVHHPDAHAPVKRKPSKLKATEAPQPKAAARPAARPTTKKKVPVRQLIGDNPAARKADMPRNITPMLATLVDEPFDRANWFFEIKWDGYRAVAYCEDDRVELISRNLKPFTEKYAPVTDALRGLGFQAVFDGEIVAVNEKGLANFQVLQNWQNTPSRLQYFIFDVLWVDGYDITGLPLVERKRILRELLAPEDEVIKYSDHVIANGNAFFKVAVSKGLEGIMAKRAESIYQPDTRTDDWLKIKVNLRQEVVIAGYTEPRRTRKFFGSLLLGVYDGDELVYVGHTGSGFNTKSLEAIYKTLQPLVTDRSPFAQQPKTNMPATWVKPKLVCEIKFTEWTKDRMARHPIFMGLRSDKKASDVTFEKAVNMATLSKGSKAAPKKAAAKKTTAKGAAKKAASKSSPQKKSPVSSKGSGKQLDLEAGEDQQVKLNGQVLQLTNLKKVYWPWEGFRKGDMINYYLQMAPYILPYLLGRPHSLNRHPNGIEEKNFFQKDMKGKGLEWMQTHVDFSESTNVHVEYLVCSNEASLIYMANLGCIEMNPWHSRSGRWQYPDWCLIDLDPDKSNTFDEVMEVAKRVKEVLDSIGAAAYCKTSGSTGIHIYIPLGATYTFEQSKQLAELVVNLVNQQMPQLTSVERSPAKRKGKIYLDFLQNRETQTAAAPYSLRPRPGVPVSTPLDWSELKKGLTIKTWNAYNIFDRVKDTGDLFKPVLGKGINLEKVLQTLAGQMK